MGKDVIYTNGVIAAREKYLLKEKLLRLCEGCLLYTSRCV